MSVRARSKWNLNVLVFKEREKPEYPEPKPLEARERTSNKLNPHMASTPGFEPGPHWWEATALTTTPPLLPVGNISSEKVLLKVMGTCQKSY